MQDSPSGTFIVRLKFNVSDESLVLSVILSKSNHNQETTDMENKS